MDIDALKKASETFKECQNESDDDGDTIAMLKLLTEGYTKSEIVLGWLWKTADQLLPVVPDTPDSVSKCIENIPEGD